MKKLSLSILLLIVIGWAAFGQQTSRPGLFWVGGDLGWNGRTYGGGAHIDTGYLMAKSLYFNLVGAFFLSDNTSLLCVAGIKIFPLGNGVMAGLELVAETYGRKQWIIGVLLQRQKLDILLAG